MTIVSVSRVQIPALSTIGYGYGEDIETGEQIKFVGDHRPMRHLGEALAKRCCESDQITVELEGYEILERHPEVRA